MFNILISLLIGFIAGAIDITPMLIKKLDKLFVLSAFTYWLVLGILIPRITIVPFHWLNGIIIALIIYIPLLFLIIKLDKKAIPLITITNIVLGAGVGFVSGIFIK